MRPAQKNHIRSQIKNRRAERPQVLPVYGCALPPILALPVKPAKVTTGGLTPRAEELLAKLKAGWNLVVTRIGGGDARIVNGNRKAKVKWSAVIELLAANIIRTTDYALRRREDGRTFDGAFDTPYRQSMRDAHAAMTA